MQTLLLFLSRAYPLFLFIFLQLMCLILMINHHHYQRVSYLHGATAVNAYIDDKVTDMGKYLSLTEVNEGLMQQNKLLLEQQFNAKNDYALAPKDTFCDQTNAALYTVRAAKVVNQTVKRQHNYLTINQGSNHGIYPEMGVIGKDGLVGIVKNVSGNYATVMTLLHKESRISARIKTTGNFGSLHWNGKNEKVAQLLDIPSYVPIPIGDSLFTSGYSAIFPQGIFVGTVLEKNISPGDNFYILSIQLATNFSTLSEVYIIEHADREERLKLEAQTDKGLLE